MMLQPGALTSKLTTLIRCELWEHRSTFLVLPAVLAGITLLVVLLLLILPVSDHARVKINSNQTGGEEVWIGEQVRSNVLIEFSLKHFQRGSDEQRGEKLQTALQFLPVGLLGSLWLVQFFYFLNCLYTDRQNSSILFWKSMPVSDSLTVISKLITGSLVLPAIYIGMVIPLQFLTLLLYTLLAWFTPDSAVAGLWGMVWVPANLPGEWFGYLAQLAFSPLWYLPWFGWLLAVSAWARSLPFLWAIGVPALAGGLVQIFGGRFFQSGDFYNGGVLSWIDTHTPSIMLADWPALTTMTDQLLSREMLVSSAIGVTFLLASIWQRGKTVIL